MAHQSFQGGSEKTWSDKYGDWLFYGPIVLGAVGSFLAGLWKFLTSDGGNRSSALLQRTAALTAPGVQRSSAFNQARMVPSLISHPRLMASNAA